MEGGRGWVKEGGCFELNNLVCLTFHSLFCGRVQVPIIVVLSHLLLKSKVAEEESQSLGMSRPASGPRDLQTVLFASGLLSPTWLGSLSQTLIMLEHNGI